jgi:hypothetical protein
MTTTLSPSLGAAVAAGFSLSALFIVIAVTFVVLTIAKKFNAIKRMAKFFDLTEWTVLIWGAVGGAAFGVIVLIIAIELIF